jgi:hypothetical protein
MKLFTQRGPAQKIVSRIKLVVTSTILGMLVRLPIMLAVMFVILHYIMGFTESITIALLFVQVIYIIVISAYTIPVAFVIARAVNKNLKVGNQLSENPSTISTFYFIS